MDFTIRLHAGPLDGNAFHGTEGKEPKDWLDLGAKAYAESECCKIGNTFDTINPDQLGQVGNSTGEVLCHTYKVVSSRVGRSKTGSIEREKVIFEADYVGPSDKRENAFLILPDHPVK